eukprot:118310-Chlamydomonas_euryale.AAC.4
MSCTCTKPEAGLAWRGLVCGSSGGIRGWRGVVCGSSDGTRGWSARVRAAEGRSGGASDKL